MPSPGVEALSSLQLKPKLHIIIASKFSPPLHVGNLLSPVKSLEGEQSVVLAFNAEA